MKVRGTKTSGGYDPAMASLLEKDESSINGDAKNR